VEAGPRRPAGGKLFAWTATPKVIHAGRYREIDAEANFDLARFAPCSATTPRSAARCRGLLRELRLLKAEPLAEAAPARNKSEPVSGGAPPNEPGPSLVRPGRRRKTNPTAVP
jgi:hypothetical protein